MTSCSAKETPQTSWRLCAFARPLNNAAHTTPPLDEASTARATSPPTSRRAAEPQSRLSEPSTARETALQLAPSRKGAKRFAELRPLSHRRPEAPPSSLRLCAPPDRRRPHHLSSRRALDGPRDGVSDLAPSRPRWGRQGRRHRRGTPSPALRLGERRRHPRPLCAFAPLRDLKTTPPTPPRLSTSPRRPARRRLGPRAEPQSRRADCPSPRRHARRRFSSRQAAKAPSASPSCGPSRPDAPRHHQALCASAPLRAS